MLKTVLQVVAKLNLPRVTSPLWSQGSYIAGAAKFKHFSRTFKDIFWNIQGVYIVKPRVD